MLLARRSGGCPKRTADRLSKAVFNSIFLLWSPDNLRTIWSTNYFLIFPEGIGRGWTKLAVFYHRQYRPWKTFAWSGAELRKPWNTLSRWVFLSFNATRISANDVEYPIDVVFYKKNSFQWWHIGLNAINCKIFNCGRRASCRESRNCRWLGQEVFFKPIGNGEPMVEIKGESILWWLKSNIRQNIFTANRFCSTRMSFGLPRALVRLKDHRGRYQYFFQLLSVLRAYGSWGYVSDIVWFNARQHTWASFLHLSFRLRKIIRMIFWFIQRGTNSADQISVVVSAAFRTFS